MTAALARRRLAWQCRHTFERTAFGFEQVVSMGNLIGRVASNLGVLIGVSALCFALVYIIPSDPVRAVAGPKADAATLASIRSELGLDRPLPVQYAIYLGRLVRGDLGRSYVTNEDVAGAIIERLPATAYLALTSVLFSLVVGIGLALVVAVRGSPVWDRVLLAAALVAVSLPTFWVGMMLLYAFAFRLRILPLGGFGLAHVILPACALGLGLAGYYARIMTSSLREVLAQDYIRSAQAKGLSRLRVYGIHALRNALLPLVTLLGLDLAGLMGGVVLTETVFNWPGIGRLAVDAAFNQDIPMIMGTVLFSAVLVVVANTLADATYSLIDPRIGKR